MTAAAPATTKKHYKATFILDTRGREESVDQLIEEIRKELVELGLEVLETENLGRHEFARKPDPDVPAGNYVRYDLVGGRDTAARMQDHFRLNKVVYRILVQSQPS